MPSIVPPSSLGDAASTAWASRTAAEQSASVRTGNGMVQVGGCGQRFDRLIREVVVQHAAQPDGKLLAFDAAAFASSAAGDKLQLRGAR